MFHHFDLSTGLGSHVMGILVNDYMHVGSDLALLQVHLEKSHRSLESLLVEDVVALNLLLDASFLVESSEDLFLLPRVDGQRLQLLFLLPLLVVVSLFLEVDLPQES